jgi:hypothetical protein
MKTVEETTEWVNGLTPMQLLAEYDMFNIQRERLSNSLGGRYISGDDAKKVERLTKSINIMRYRILDLMGVEK